MRVAFYDDIYRNDDFVKNLSNYCKENGYVFNIYNKAGFRNVSLVVYDYIFCYENCFDEKYAEKIIVIGQDKKGDKQKDFFDEKIEIFHQEYIPKIIHFMWLNSDGTDSFPEKNERILNTWYENNKDFIIVKWTNSDIEYLLTFFDDDIRNFYKKINVLISKCDFARFLIVYLCGGLYSDIDFYCNKNMREAIRDKKHIFFREVPEHEKRGNKLFNGFFAASPGNSFIWEWLYYMQKNYKTIKTTNDVMNITGPYGFYRYYLTKKIILDDPCLFIPYCGPHEKNHQTGVASSICLTSEEPYTYTYWNEGSSWGRYLNSNDGGNDALVLGLIFFVFFYVAFYLFVLIFVLYVVFRK